MRIAPLNHETLRNKSKGRASYLEFFPLSIKQLRPHLPDTCHSSPNNKQTDKRVLLDKANLGQNLDFVVLISLTLNVCPAHIHVPEIEFYFT